MADVPLAYVEDLPEDRGINVKIGDKSVALFRVGRRVYAIDNMCPHAGSFLHTGYLEKRIVRCPMHGWDFDVKSGESPTFEGVCVRTYPVRVKKGAIYSA